MTRVVLASVAGRALSPLTWELPDGVVTLVDGAGGFAAELAGFVAGVTRPRRGTVRIDSADPFRSPETRRLVASVLEVEAPLEGSSVGDAVAGVLRLRGSVRSAWDVLGEQGLAAWSLRRPDSLSSQERRRLALSLALAIDAPRVVVLVEPLLLSPSRGALAEALAARARRGAVVLCITASARGATDLGGRVFGLRPFASAPVEEPWAGVSRAGGAAELVVHADDPAKLALALAAEPVVATVASASAGAKAELVVQGADLALASLAVMRAAKASDVTVSSWFLRTFAPAPVPVRAAPPAEAAP